MTSAVSGERGETSEVARHVGSVAARLFAARGYDATSVREIVEAAGVTKPTLYYHYGSKEGLAQALLTVPLNRLAATLRSIAAAPGEPASILAGAIEAHFAFCRDDPDRARFVYALLFGPLGSSLAAEVGRIGEELTSALGAAVDNLVTSGHVASARRSDLLMACRGMIVIATMDFLYGGKSLDPELAVRLVGDLLEGFANTCSEPLAREKRV